MPNVFSIADDILFAGFNEEGKDHNETFDKVLWVCKKVNLKLNRDMCLFTCTSIPLFGEVIFWQGVSMDPRKVQALMDMPLPKSSKELQSLLGVLNYPSTFSPATEEVCKPCGN